MTGRRRQRRMDPDLARAFGLLPELGTPFVPQYPDAWPVMVDQYVHGRPGLLGTSGGWVATASRDGRTGEGAARTRSTAHVRAHKDLMRQEATANYVAAQEHGVTGRDLARYRRETRRPPWRYLGKRPR